MGNIYMQDNHFVMKISLLNLLHMILSAFALVSNNVQRLPMLTLYSGIEFLVDGSTVNFNKMCMDKLNLCRLFDKTVHFC